MKAVTYADGKVKFSIVPRPIGEGVIIDIAGDKNSKNIKVVFDPSLT